MQPSHPQWITKSRIIHLLYLFTGKLFHVLNFPVDMPLTNINAKFFPNYGSN